MSNNDTIEATFETNSFQGAFTIKEVRELIQLPNVYFDTIPEHLFPPESTITGLPRAQKRMIQLLAKGSTTRAQDSTKSWSLDFLLSPHSFHASSTDPTRLSHVKFTRNQLDPADPFATRASVSPLIGDDGKAAQVDLPANVCFRSIGYQSLPLRGFEELNIPFNDSRGVIPNDGYGRVLNTSPLRKEGEETPDSVPVHVPGIYCAGWVKRGPTGVIASTMTDAFATADAVAADWESHCSPGSNSSSSNNNNGSSSHHLAFLNSAEGGSTGLGWAGVRPEAERLGLRPTSWRDWEEIDRAEKERGAAKGKLREKFASVSDMLRALP